MCKKSDVRRPAVFVCVYVFVSCVVYLPMLANLSLTRVLSLSLYLFLQLSPSLCIALALSPSLPRSRTARIPLLALNLSLSPLLSL